MLSAVPSSLYCFSWVLNVSANSHSKNFSPTELAKHKRSEENLSACFANGNVGNLKSGGGRYLSSQGRGGEQCFSHRESR